MFEALILVKKYWKLIAMALLCAVIGIMYLTIKAQGLVIEKQKISITVLTDANNSNAATITNLKNEREKINTICDQRLKEKEELIRKLQAIENTTGGGHEIADSADSLLNMLNRMYQRNRQN